MKENTGIEKQKHDYTVIQISHQHQSEYLVMCVKTS